ncbi:MAG: iron-containing alcohol dehydrogenase [Bacteroidetes bacterium]|nr:MAG: iron-containing alcohol dehydrogenase [Bacteroidota bacterium]
MLNFEYHNPVKIVFGKDQLPKLPSYLSDEQVSGKVLILYGGGSIEKTGLLDRIKQVLSSYQLSYFKGVEANPEYSTLMKAVEQIRQENIEFVLAVGGGSVIDAAKFIVGAVNYDGEPWDVLARKGSAQFKDALPFGTILTLPATGSEANSGAVISRSEIQEKRTMGGPLFFPKFSFLDPTLIATLPERQIANGIIDAFMHTLEQYLTYPTQNRLQEREAEAILQTLIEIGPKVLQNPSDYDAAANLMWCATHALNGNLRCGVPTDWATHMIGHELTALFGIDHARTLAIVAPRLYEQLFEEKKEKLQQYGQRVWNLDGSPEQIAQKAIEETETFFQRLGVNTRLSSYSPEAPSAVNIVRERFLERNWHLGEHKNVDALIAAKIVEQSL